MFTARYGLQLQNSDYQTKTPTHILSSCPLLHTTNSPVPVTLPSSLPNALPWFRHTFTRRTSGCCLKTFTAVKFLFPPPSPPCISLYNIDWFLYPRCRMFTARYGLQLQNSVYQTNNPTHILSSCPLLHTTNSPVLVTLPSSLPNALPWFRHTFTRRTSGCCLKTFTAVKFLFPPPMYL